MGHAGPSATEPGGPVDDALSGAAAQPGRSGLGRTGSAAAVALHVAAVPGGGAGGDTAFGAGGGASDTGGRTGVRISACHDGYAHLPGRPRHWRHWEWASDGACLVVSDELAAGPVFAHWAVQQAPSVARYHLAPGLTLAQQDACTWRVQAGTELLATAHVEEGRASVEAWQHAAAFGELQDACTLAVALDPRTGRSRVVWRWGATALPSPALPEATFERTIED